MLLLLRFLTFFLKIQKRDFLRFCYVFSLLHTFSRTMTSSTPNRHSSAFPAQKLTEIQPIWTKQHSSPTERGTAQPSGRSLR